MANFAVDLAPDLRMSREEYRRWAEEQPTGRFERVDGVVIAMAPERSNHARRKALVWLALRQAVAAVGLPCEVFPDGMAVTVDESDFEPDALLRCGDALAGDEITVPDPVVVVEVLSPRTRGVDLTRKLVAYFQLPSVQHYLVFWADRPQVVHHRRREDGQGVETRLLTEGAIRLDPPGISITLAEVYGA
jgi:Uma2 family endonuclease